MDDEAAPLVRMTGVSKSYGGAHACRDVDFTVYAGEVHALLGENGAGKSTLMRVRGRMKPHPRPGDRHRASVIGLRAAEDARRAGIAMIHQELDLVPGLSVAENIFLGREPRTRWGVVDSRGMIRETTRLLGRTGVALDARRLVGRLRTGEQQLVAIAKALSLDARVLVMDEPTSALSFAEVERMFGVIGELRGAGVGIVYISHRMQEIGRIANRATVLRNGAVVAEFAEGALNPAAVAEAMVGRDVRSVIRRPRPRPGDPVLEVDGLAVLGRASPGWRAPNGITLTVRRGEIVGLAGLLGSGRTELVETLFGAGPAGRWSGSVRLLGRSVRPRGPRQAVRLGMALVPEDRRVAGLALDHSVLANTVLSIVERMARFGVASRRDEITATERIVRELRVKLASVHARVDTLSGGNQQKVVFGRMLLTEPTLLLLDEPTRGVDVGAKTEIYQLLRDIAARGVAVLLASSELAELAGVCDRVVVLRDGRSVTEFEMSTADGTDLLAAAMGEDAAGADLPRHRGPMRPLGGRS